MNRRQFCTTLAGACLVAVGAESAKDKTPVKDAPPPAPVDVLAKMREWNSDKFAAPPTEFRPGHVTPRTLDEKAVTRTADGFTVQLPSKAPIPTPSVYKGKVYVSGGFHSKEFYCLNAQTGGLVWGLNLDDDGPTAAACDDDVIVINTESCTIFALDAATGKHLWSYWLGDPLTSTPTIAGGRVFTSYPAGGRGAPANLNEPPVPPGAQQQAAPPPPKPAKRAEGKPAPPCSHVLAALDLKTGKILWQRWIDSDVMSAPVAVDQEVYVATFAGMVCQFNQADGTILSATQSRATSAPVIVGKNVYYTQRVDDGKKAEEACVGVGRADGRTQFQGPKKDAAYLDAGVQERSQLKGEAMKLDAANGFAGGAPVAANHMAAKENVGQDNVWSMQTFQGSRLLNHGGRNFSCMGDEVVCSDPDSGKTLWTWKLAGDLHKQGGFLAAPPAAAGDHLILATLQGEVHQMDPVKGKVTKTWKVGSPTRFQPAIEGGRIYVGTLDGKVVCLDTKDATLTGWPCWGGNAAHTGLARPTAGK